MNQYSVADNMFSFACEFKWTIESIMIALDGAFIICAGFCVHGIPGIPKCFYTYIDNIIWRMLF